MLTLLHFCHVFRRALRHMYIVVVTKLFQIVIVNCYNSTRVVQLSCLCSIISANSSNNEMTIDHASQREHRHASVAFMGNT